MAPKPCPNTDHVIMMPHSTKPSDATREFLGELDGIYSPLMQKRRFALRHCGPVPASAASTANARTSKSPACTGREIGSMQLAIAPGNYAGATCYFVMITCEVQTDSGKTVTLSIESYVNARLETLYECFAVSGALTNRVHKRYVWLLVGSGKYVVEDVDEFVDDTEGSSSDSQSSYMCVLRHKSCYSLMFQGAEFVFQALLASHIALACPDAPTRLDYFVFRDSRSGLFHVSATGEPVSGSHIHRNQARRLYCIYNDYIAVGTNSRPLSNSPSVANSLSSTSTSSSSSAPSSSSSSSASTSTSSSSSSSSASSSLRIESVLASYSHLRPWQQMFCEPEGRIRYIVGVFGLEITAEDSMLANGGGDAAAASDDIELEAMFEELRCSDLTRMRDKLGKFPELVHVLTEWQRNLLIKKPADVYEFTRRHFSYEGMVSILGTSPSTSVSQAAGRGKI